MLYGACFASRGDEPVDLTTSPPVSTRRLQFEKMEGIPELGGLSEQEEEGTATWDRQSTPRTPGGDVPDQGPAFPDPQQHQRQVTHSLPRTNTHARTHSDTQTHTHTHTHTLLFIVQRNVRNYRNT